MTGLEFNLPDADYIKTTIPNFVCQRTGYQCLEQVAKAFSIPDCVWFQHTDQVVYFGSYQDSHFHNKPVALPEEFTSRQSGNSVTFIPFPMLRPGRVMNDKRVNRVDLIQDEMTAYWKAEQSEVSPKKRETLQNFPELAAGFHLPKFGRVEAVRDTAIAGQIADPFRPRFAVDVQVLDENLNPDINVPVYRSIPLPVHMSRHESGLLSTHLREHLSKSSSHMAGTTSLSFVVFMAVNMRCRRLSRGNNCSINVKRLATELMLQEIQPRKPNKRKAKEHSKSSTK